VRRAILLLAAVAVVLSGCGSSGRNLLTQRNADSMTKYLDKIEASLGKNPPDCEAARRAAASGGTQARALPNRVDPELKTNLADWFAHLQDQTRQECNRLNAPSATPTATATTEPSSTPTAEPSATSTPDKTATPDATSTSTPDATSTPDTGGAQPDSTPGVDGQQG
jgi:hypothetical protein